MLKLKRLRVERFRSLARGAELSFSDGINIVLGQNGTGKTTLLDLISMVVRSDFSSLAKEEFALEYELWVPGGESIIIMVRNHRAVMDEPPTPIEIKAREVFHPSVEVLGGADRRRLVRYDDVQGISRGESPSESPQRSPTPMDLGFLFYFIAPVKAFGSRFATYLTLLAGNAYRLDESLDLFRKATGTGTFAGEIVRVKDAWLPDLFDPPFIPFDVIKELKNHYEPGAADYALSHHDLGVLSTLNEMMQFARSDLRIDVTESSEPETMRIDNLVFRFWWTDGTLVTHERLSYGQKRLLIFFYYLACNSEIVIADELVNGLHHRWITASIEAIGQRQAFLTSQNPLLLDYVPITSAEEVQRSFVLCRGEPREGRPGWIWENMSEEDAQELFNAYNVGVEHVSEILQSRGLW
ncbi:MAG TPA: AAA family ATPase [Kofleriaceae bacterium]|jgi:hypothetical protein